MPRKINLGKSINNYINIYIIINDIDSKMERSNNSNGKKENKEEFILQKNIIKTRKGKHSMKSL